MTNPVVARFHRALITAGALILIAGGTLAQGPVGEWDMKMSFGDREITGKLIIAEGDEGALLGKWISQQGEGELSNVSFEAGKLTFARSVSFGAQGFDMTFEGTIDGDNLSGNFVTEFGEMPVTGTRPAAVEATASKVSPLAGTWDVLSVSQLGEFRRKLVVKPDLSATYESEEATWPINQLKLDGDKVSFDVTVNLQGQELPLQFTGVLAGARITGNYSMADFGSVSEVTITKVVNPAAALFGTWKVTTTTQAGDQQRVLVINEDLTGTYETDAKAPIRDLVVENGQVTFSVTVQRQGFELPLDFKGKLEEGVLQGIFEIQGREVAQLKGTKDG